MNIVINSDESRNEGVEEESTEEMKRNTNEVVEKTDNSENNSIESRSNSGIREIP